jgi:hypothetical protein
MRALTPEIIAEARSIRLRHRVPWTRLARSLGVNCTALRRNLNDLPPLGCRQWFSAIRRQVAAGREAVAS